MSIFFPNRYLRPYSAKYEHGYRVHREGRSKKKSRSDQAAPQSPFSSSSVQPTQSGSSVNQWLVTLDNRICQIRLTTRFIALLSFKRRMAKYLDSCVHDPSEAVGVVLSPSDVVMPQRRQGLAPVVCHPSSRGGDAYRKSSLHKPYCSCLLSRELCCVFEFQHAHTQHTQPHTRGHASQL